MSIHFTGLAVGLATFGLIGLFHPIVICAEYHWGRRSIPWFVTSGFVLAALALVVSTFIPSVLLGVTACCAFWSIIEIVEQEMRVVKGWYPENPKRHEHYEALRRAHGLVSPSDATSSARAQRNRKDAS